MGNFYSSRLLIVIDEPVSMNSSVYTSPGCHPSQAGIAKPQHAFFNTLAGLNAVDIRQHVAFTYTVSVS